MCLCREIESVLTRVAAKAEKQYHGQYEGNMLSFNLHFENGERRVTCSIEDGEGFGKAQNVQGAFEIASREHYLANTPTAVHQ